MACSPCNSNSNQSYPVNYYYSSPCVQSNCQGSCIGAECIYYGGPNLLCSGINTGDYLDTILQKIDQQICQASGDYSTYNVHCLGTPPITTEAQFVDTITNYVCTLRSDFDTFVSTTFVNYQSSVSTQFDNINNPGFTSCAYLGITSTDTLSEAINKIITGVCNLGSTVDLSSVNFSQCISVSPAPTTIQEGFQTVIDQICQVRTMAMNGATLPTFNNTGSCLPTPGANDSLVDTVNKIKTRLCQSPTFDINALTWGCTTKPSSTTTDLQSAFQTVLTTTNDYKQNKLTFSGDFVITQTNPSDPCQGKTVALAIPSSQDRFVASTPSDSSPGTLQQKLAAGINISLDYSTTPGQVIINNTGEVGGHKVLANSVDTVPGYLDEKTEGGSDVISGLSISTSYDAINQKLAITPSISMDTLVNAIFDLIESDADLKTRFCTIISTCPSPCAAPTNVQAIPA